MNFFKKLSYSITDIRRYPDMMLQGVGKAFAYLLLFTLLFGTLNSIAVSYQVKQSIGKFTADLKNNLPDFTFENGELNVKEKMPIVIDGSKNDVVIIDTTGKTEEDVLHPYESGMLILKDRLIAKRNTTETRIISFSDFKELSFTRKDVIDFLPYLTWIAPLIGILAWVGFFIGKMLSALFLTIINLIVSNIRKANLRFSQLYSLSMYSLSLPILLDIIFKLFHSNLINVVYYLIALVYGWLVIGYVKKQAELVQE